MLNISFLFLTHLDMFLHILVLDIPTQKMGIDNMAHMDIYVKCHLAFKNDLKYHDKSKSYPK